MNESELERLERIVASLAEDNKAAKVRQAALDKQLAELAEQNKAYALRLEEDRVKREEEHTKREEEHTKREEEHTKREEERAKREEERAKREEERAEAEARREEERAKREEERERREAKYEEERRRERAAAEKRMNKLDELFTGQWGKLMEALVKGELTRLLNQRGIPVQGLAREHERKDPSGREYELDIIAINGSSVVAVEVKTTLQLEYVQSFLEKLPRFKDVFWEYRDKEIIGAIAYLKANQGSNIYAAKQGLYVIRAVGNGASIINAANFKPRIF